MTTKKIIILSSVILTAGGLGFYLWWRQRDSVPQSALPQMGQARITLAPGS